MFRNINYGKELSQLEEDSLEYYAGHVIHACKLRGKVDEDEDDEQEEQVETTLEYSYLKLVNDGGWLSPPPHRIYQKHYRSRANFS